MHVRPTRSQEEFLCDKLFDWALSDDEDLDKVLLQASDEFESKIMPRATAPSRAPSTTSAAYLPPAKLTASASLYKLHT